MAHYRQSKAGQWVLIKYQYGTQLAFFMVRVKEPEYRENEVYHGEGGFAVIFFIMGSRHPFDDPEKWLGNDPTGEKIIRLLKGPEMKLLACGL